jgi:hypothetical protein
VPHLLRNLPIEFWLIDRSEYLIFSEIGGTEKLC